MNKKDRAYYDEALKERRVLLQRFNKWWADAGTMLTTKPPAP